MSADTKIQAVPRRRTNQCGPKNPFWKGGRSVASNGYVLIRAAEHPDADVRGYIYEHRLVAQAKIGRRLLSSEQVHHLDGDKQNNDPGNLEVVSIQQHRAAHRRSSRGLREPGAENPLVACACGCGTALRRFDACNRPRRFVTGHNTGQRDASPRRQFPQSVPFPSEAATRV